MSDNYLRICPVDPALIPPEAAARAAVNIVGPALPEADEVLAESYGFPVFIDQGANLTHVLCPACAARLSFLDDESIRDWWYALVDPLEGRTIVGVNATMPCCNAVVPFSSLAFDWPGAVASFEISVRNPGIGDPLPAELIQQLQSVLGCELRQIWAHY